MKLNKISRYKPTEVQPSDFLINTQKTYIGGKTASSTNGIGKIRYPLVEE
jgi:hypothetical protein